MHFAIHIGFHKCASTFLQQGFFPHLPVNYIYLSSSDREDLDYIEHHSAFDPEVFSKRIRDLIAQRGQGTTRNMTLLSQEELSGHLHGHDHVNSERIAYRLHETFPEARILMIIRNPFEYMMSLYSYSVTRNFEHRSFHDFLNEEGPSGLFDKLEYQRLAGLYSSLFGTGRVLVLPVELLDSKPFVFLVRITDFLDLPSVRPTDTTASNTTIRNRHVLRFWSGVNRIAAKVLRLLHDHSPKGQLQQHPFRRTRRLFFHAKDSSNSILRRLLPDSSGLSFEDYPDYDSLFTRYSQDTVSLSRITGLALREYGYPGACGS